MESTESKTDWKVLLSPLVRKLVLITIAPTLTGLALLATLMLFQYEQIIRNAVEQRYLLSAGEIKTRSEQWLKSGLLPRNIPNMQTILASIDEQIEEEFSVDIIDNTGVVIYSLDPSRLQDIVKASILRDLNTFIEENNNTNGTATHNLIYNENNQRFIITPLFDNIGNWSAAVITSFPQSIYADIVDKTTYRILYYFAIISIAIILVALIVGGLILKKPVRLLNELQRRFATISDDNVNFAKQDLKPLEKTLTKNLQQMDEQSAQIHAIDLTSAPSKESISSKKQAKKTAKGKKA